MTAMKKSPTITSEGASAAPSPTESTTTIVEGKTTKRATSKQKRASLLAAKNKKDEFTKKILEQASRVRQSFERKNSGIASSSTAGVGFGVGVGVGGSSQNNKSSSSMLSRSAGVQHSAFQPYAAFGNTTSKTATVTASISSTTLNSCSSSLSNTRNLLGIRRQSSSQSIDPALMAEQLTLSWNNATQAQEAAAISRSRRSRAGQEVWEGLERSASPSSTIGKGPRRRRASISGHGPDINNSMGLSTSMELEKATSRTNCNDNEDEDVRKQELLKNLYSGRRRRSAGDLEQDDCKQMNDSNTMMPHARKRQSASSTFDDDTINSMPRKRHSASSNFDLEDIQNNMNHEDEEAEPITASAANTFISTPLIRESMMKKLDYEEAAAASSGLGTDMEKEEQEQDQAQDKDSKQYQELYQLALKYQERSSPQETVMLNAPPYQQIALNNNDVVASTGSTSVHDLTETLIGNRRIQVLLELHHKKYSKATSAQYRTNEARAIVQAIHHAVPQGRFLTVDSQQGIWAVMPPLWSIHFVERALASYSLSKKKACSQSTAKSTYLSFVYASRHRGTSSPV
jgi:hypothetical protein